MKRLNKNSSRQTRLRACACALICILGLAGGMVLPGCNIVGGAAYLIHGPEKVPKQFSLDPLKKAVVFVDDTAPVVKSRMQRMRIASTAEQALLKEGKMEHIIASADLQSIVDRERFSKPLGIDEVGEAVGAEVVIYAQMLSFNLTPDEQSFIPSAQVRVKVVDAKEKKRVWPQGLQEWYVLDVSPREKQGPPPTTLSERDAAYLQLAERVGRSIAYLFIEHEAKTVNGKLDQ